MAEYGQTNEGVGISRPTLQDSFGVEVRTTTGTKGKGLFAVRAFKENDILFEEKPLVCSQFSWNATYKYLACNHCMRPLENAEENARCLTGNAQLVLPYPDCCPTNKNVASQCTACGVGYCSIECQESAWNQHHKTLCIQSRNNPAHPLEQLNEVWKQMHYPPETATIMLLARVLATVRQAKDKTAAVQLFMQFCHKTVNEEEEIAHKLLGEEFAGQIKLLQELTSQALYEDSVSHWLTPEGFRSLVALVGTNGQGVGTSAISEWVKNTEALDLPEDEKQQLETFIDKLYKDLDKESGSFLNNEGSALYTLQSASNHSCEPNALPTFPHSNFQLAMRATKDIAPGEEIFISYLDECDLERSRLSRQMLLRENYLFNCWCSKCTSQINNTDLTSDDETEDEEMDECA